jgi:hypothetical protein
MKKQTSKVKQINIKKESHSDRNERTEKYQIKKQRKEEDKYGIRK